MPGSQITPGARLRQARSKRYAQAKEAATAHGWGVSTYISHENGTRGFRFDTAQVYARAFGVDATWLMTGRNPPVRGRQTVPLVGYVGAGGSIMPVDDHAQGAGIEEVEAPPDLDQAVVAVQVRGDSMYPAFHAGDIIYYGEHVPPDTIAGKDCVVQFADGRMMVKTLHRAGDAYTFSSYNAPPILAPFNWVAPVLWIKRR